MTATAYGYIRWSSAGQTEGDSHARQEKLHRVFAEEKNLTLHMLPVDSGVSARKGNNFRNGALGKFIGDVGARKIPPGSWLLIEDFDRFSRDEASVAYEKFLGLINAGIVIATTTDGRVCRRGDDFTSFLIPLIKLQGAHDENVRRAGFVKKAIATRRETATRDNPMTARVPLWLKVTQNGTRREIVEDRPRADIVREIFGMAVRGMGNGAIAAELNDRSIPPFSKARGWHKTYIHKILTNRAVIGEFQPHETDKLGGLEGDERGDKRRQPIGEPKKD